MRSYKNQLTPRAVSAFPNPLAHPKVKADKKKWGLPLAWAIYTNYQMTGYKTLFGDSVVYDNYLSYAFGEQDKSKYAPGTDGDPKDVFHQFIPRIKDDIKNYASKRIRIVCEKLENNRFDPIANVTDSSAIDRRKDYESRLRLSMEQQSFLAELTEMTGVNQFPEGVDPKNLPFDEDDLRIDMELNYKDKISMKLEKGMSYHLSHNDYETAKAEIDFDLAVIGGACLHVGMDQNYRPTIKRIRPDLAIVPEASDPFYRNMPYGGYIEYMSVHDFRMHHNGELSKEEEEHVIRTYSESPSAPYVKNMGSNVDLRDANTIPVMYFEYKSTNEEVHLEYKDSNGNDRFIEKDYNYYKTFPQRNKFKEKYGASRKLHRKPYPAIYKGYWVVGTDCIYQYGPKEFTVYDRQGGKIGDPMIGFIVCTPGVRDGRSAGLIKQMIPVLDDLQFIELKIQETLANPFPGGAVIDLFALRKANFTLGGKALKPEDLIKMAFKNKLVLIDTQDGNYAAGSNYTAVQEMNLGVPLADQLQLLQHRLIELDEIIGYNQSTNSSPTLSDRTPVRVANMQQQNTDLALGFLYRADYFMFKQTCKLLAGLHLLALKYDPEHYSHIFGEDTVEFLNSDEFDPDEIEYGIEIEPRPTDDEWNIFYARLEKLESEGRLSASDIIQIQRFNNLKQAQTYMRVLEKRREREAHQRQMELVDAQTAGNIEAVKTRGQLIHETESAKQETERVKGEQERQNLLLKHKLMMEQIERRESLGGFTKDFLQDKKGQVDVLLKAMELAGAKALADSKPKKDD